MSQTPLLSIQTRFCEQAGLVVKLDVYVICMLKVGFPTELQYETPRKVGPLKKCFC